MASEDTPAAEAVSSSIDLLVDSIPFLTFLNSIFRQLWTLKKFKKKCFEQLLRSYDPEMGGFSKAPKFPQPVNFNFLFHYYSLKPQEDRAKQGLKMVLHTLDMMAKGGIHDHISQVS